MTMDIHSHLYNIDFVDELYEIYLTDPQQLNDEWRAYFDQFKKEKKIDDIPHTPIKSRFIDNKPHLALKNRTSDELEKAALLSFAKKEASVLRLINAYRFRGHQQANLDPLQQAPRPPIEDLDPAYYGLTQADMQTEFDTGSFHGVDNLKLADLLTRLKKVYCGNIGAEYMHITDTKQKRWIQRELEGSLCEVKLDVECKRQILEQLTAAQGLEEFLHTAYVGQKRFSLEGGESLIPLLDKLIQYSGEQGTEEIILGMAHRGRLNVLVNILGKRPKDLFSEFEGKILKEVGSGDVKYHQGFSSDVMTPGGLVHVAMAFNPSHLEIINPVVEGAVRARQERRKDKLHLSVIPVLIHGDAAFAGQGVIMETLNLSQTRGYSTGGTIHIIINNQIGFTMSDPLDSRSTLYCTDVAKMVQAPIFHVNGDDPEAVVFVTKIALDYRLMFNKDVVIDMICYRRLGHNEADEPAATQPAMYDKIASHTKVQTLYAQKLIDENVIGAEESEIFLQQYRAALKTKEVVSRPVSKVFKHGVNWKPYTDTHWTKPVDTSINIERLQKLIRKFSVVPEDFTLHRSVQRVIQNRQKMAAGEMPIDWGCAEALAFATLLEEGYPIRLSGQDSARGTFAHRHSVLHDQKTGKMHIPLQYLAKDQSQFLVINSLLSEEAVLGFEFGYSASDPETLVLWEAQFGDFANVAQVVIDQFISSSEAKWQRYCGLVLLLPHGYDGQGPEHSSARLERFLQLCAEDNIQVVVPSTPAQFFHLLRRQMLRPYRKPLIVMTPKSLLRHKLVVSKFEDFTDVSFQTVIDEINPKIVPEKVERLLFCSGKVYYDLLEARADYKLDNVAIIRIEQLYPYPSKEMEKILTRYTHVKHRIWVQEEPRNQGAWWYIRAHLDINLRHETQCLEYAGRPPSASPAVGYLQFHRQQLKDLLTAAFTATDLEQDG